MRCCTDCCDLACLLAKGDVSDVACCCVGRKSDALDTLAVDTRCWVCNAMTSLASVVLASLSWLNDYVTSAFNFELNTALQRSCILAGDNGCVRKTSCSFSTMETKPQKQLKARNTHAY